MGGRQRDGDGLDGGQEAGETDYGTALFSHTQKYPTAIPDTNWGD